MGTKAMRRIIHSLNGSGFVTTVDGKRVDVTYWLEFWQEEIDGTGTAPTRVRGTVVPLCGALQQQLTLFMEGGSAIDFSFVDSVGTITATGEMRTVRKANQSSHGTHWEMPRRIWARVSRFRWFGLLNSART